jgi:hypothetical protein
MDVVGRVIRRELGADLRMPAYDPTLPGRSSILSFTLTVWQTISVERRRRTTEPKSNALANV